jgi:AICAR transformylase/IMP cyclohydrolase PurH
LAVNGQLLASGVGQTSRVDALKQAIEKAAAFGFDLKGSVMASDAFFPFPDCVEIAHDQGIGIQPGGSIKEAVRWRFNRHFKGFGSVIKKGESKIIETKIQAYFLLNLREKY